MRHKGERYFPKATKVTDPAVPIPLSGVPGREPESTLLMLEPKTNQLPER